MVAVEALRAPEEIAGLTATAQLTSPSWREPPHSLDKRVHDLIRSVRLYAPAEAEVVDHELRLHGLATVVQYCEDFDRNLSLWRVPEEDQITYKRDLRCEVKSMLEEALARERRRAQHSGCALIVPGEWDSAFLTLERELVDS